VPAYDILPYATAKAALNQMMVSLAHLLNKRVRVNSILIGTVVTAGYGDAGITPEIQERLSHRGSARRAVSGISAWMGCWLR
jgi:7-alpha-hydroxysteroid dehydrogenase